jgi:hypothetical protein
MATDNRSDRVRAHLNGNSMDQLYARNTHVITRIAVCDSRASIQSDRHLALARVYKTALRFGAGILATIVIFLP